LRHIVLGSSHYTPLILSALRETDPAGLIIIMDRSREAAETLANMVGGKPVSGDPMDPRTLEKADIEKADIFIASSDSDAMNIKISEAAKKNYKIPLVITLVNNPANIEEAVARGADYVISPSSPLQSHIKAILSTDKWVKTTTPEFFGIDIYLYRVVRTSMLGITLSQIRDELRGVEAYIVGLTKAGSLIRDPTYELREGDVIILVAPRGMGEAAVEKIRTMLARIQRIRAEMESRRSVYP
jgi:Trk K+ transport system NAD-binding subunit